MKPRMLLRLAMLLFFVSLLNPWLVFFLGRMTAHVGFGLKCLGLLALLGAIVAYRHRWGPVPPTNSHSVRVKLLAAWIVLLAIYGFIRGNAMTLMAFDVWAYALILLCLVLGRYDEVWKDLEKFMLILFWVGVLFVVAGLGTAEFRETMHMGGVMVEMRGDAEARSAVRTVGFNLRTMLHFWPVLFALAYFRPRMNIWKMLGLGTPLVYLALMIYFQKRAPTARAMAYVLMVVIVLPAFRKRLNVGTAVVVLTGVAILGALALGSESFESLMQRFRGEQTILHSSRALEARAFLKDMSPVEYIVGRGMGGAYRPPHGWGAGVAVHKGQILRHEFHMGVFNPLLKGGILFCLIYYSFIAPLLSPKPPGWYQNRFNLAAISVLPVYALFLLIEGMPSVLRIYDGVLLGMAAARMATPATEPALSWDYECPPGQAELAYPPGPYAGMTG